jgi:hypothetical protein
VYQAQPPPVVSRPPAASGPTAAQIRAAQRAQARANAARRAARLKKQRREARRERAAASLAAARAAQKRALARGDSRTPVSWGAADGDRAALTFVAAATVAALIIFGIGLIPARAVRSYRMSVALETHRDHVALAACITLIVAAISFTLTVLSD